MIGDIFGHTVEFIKLGVYCFSTLLWHTDAAGSIGGITAAGGFAMRRINPPETVSLMRMAKLNQTQAVAVNRGLNFYNNGHSIFSSVGECNKLRNENAPTLSFDSD